MPRVKQIAEKGFEEAYPSNLPKIDPLMVTDYFNSDMFLSPEMRNVKTQRFLGGGCKHAVAFVSWLHRVSATPSVTSTECYWKKSALASSVTSKELLTAEDIKMHKFVDVPG